MKKLLPVICALVLAGFTANAQTTVTFRVDVTNFLALGTETLNGGVYMAGNFTTSGTTDLPDWSPDAGAMTDMGNNIWEKTVTFQSPITDSLQFKYVQGPAWSDGDEGNEWTDPSHTCWMTNDHNRKLLVPASGAIVYSSNWAECGTITTAGVKAHVSLKATDVFPNPTAGKLTVRTGSDAVSAVNIIGSNGQVVMSKNLSEVRNQNLNLDVSSLPVGIYNVMVVSKNAISQKQFSVVR